MRYPIWKKDDFFETFIDGPRRIDMEADVVELPEKLPVVVNFDMNATPCGWFTDLRVEDGEITGEFTPIEAYANLTHEDLSANARFGGYYTNVDYNESDDRVLSCTLKAVSWLPNAGFPKEVLTRG